MTSLKEQSGNNSLNDTSISFADLNSENSGENFGSPHEPNSITPFSNNSMDTDTDLISEAIRQHVKMRELRHENIRLTYELDAANAENFRLEEQKREKEQEVVELKQEKSELKEKIRQLQEKNETLQRKLVQEKNEQLFKFQASFLSEMTKLLTTHFDIKDIGERVCQDRQIEIQSGEKNLINKANVEDHERIAGIVSEHEGCIQEVKAESENKLKEPNGRLRERDIEQIKMAEQIEQQKHEKQKSDAYEEDRKKCEAAEEERNKCEAADEARNLQKAFDEEKYQKRNEADKIRPQYSKLTTLEGKNESERIQQLSNEINKIFQTYFYCLDATICPEYKLCKEFEASKRKLSNEQDFQDAVNKGELIKYLYSVMQFLEFACSLLWRHEGGHWCLFRRGTGKIFADNCKEKLMLNSDKLTFHILSELLNEFHNDFCENYCNKLTLRHQWKFEAEFDRIKK